MNKYQAEAVEKGGSKRNKKIGYTRTKAIFTNEQAKKNISSGDSITRTLESKKGFTKEKIPKIKGGTKGKSLKLDNEQKIFKLEDDKKEIHIKDKFSSNKRTKGLLMRSMKIPIQFLQWIKSTRNLEKTYLNHGGLYRWRENSLPLFLYQKLKEILTR